MCRYHRPVLWMLIGCVRLTPQVTDLAGQDDFYRWVSKVVGVGHLLRLECILSLMITLQLKKRVKW